MFFNRKLFHIVSVQKTTPDTSYSDRIKEAEYNLANGEYIHPGTLPISAITLV